MRGGGEFEHLGGGLHKCHIGMGREVSLTDTARACEHVKSPVLYEAEKNSNCPPPPGEE